MNDNGSYSANTSANYIAAASSLKDADNKLDAQVKINSDNIAANTKKLQIKGEETSPDSALFRVVNKNGQTVFAVYNEGVRIYVDDGAKGKGGFVIGGFGSSKGLPNNYMLINPDSTRFYVRETGPGTSSTFNIIGINLDETQTSLLSANTGTVGIGTVLNVQNNLNVIGNIGHTGDVILTVPELITAD